MCFDIAHSQFIPSISYPCRLTNMPSSATFLELQEIEPELSTRTATSGSHMSVPNRDAPEFEPSVTSSASERSVLVPKENANEEVPLRAFLMALLIAIVSHGIAGMPSGALRFVYVRFFRVIDIVFVYSTFFRSLVL